MAGGMAWAIRRTAPHDAGDAGSADPVSPDPVSPDPVSPDPISHETVAEAGNVAVLAMLLVLLLVAMSSMALHWSVDGLRAPQGITVAQD